MKKTLTLVLAGLALARITSGQPILTTLATFDASTTNANLVFTNALGINPRGALILGRDGCFYGTTFNGGSNGWGTAFKVTTNGVLTTVAPFDNDVAQPYAGLILASNGNFYGTTDGDNNLGRVFHLTTNGVLTGIPAAVPNVSHLNTLAVDADGALYGATQHGGSFFRGAIFKMATDGTPIWSISFDAGQVNGFDSTNASGSDPWAGLTQGNDGNFYGTTSAGGSNYNGTVFRVTPNGLPTTLAFFDPGSPNENYVITNASGQNPYGELTLGRDNAFYGTTFYGGRNGNGTIFKMTTNGVMTTLATFAASRTNAAGVFTNETGANPWAKLTVGIDGSLFGTADFGGHNGNGTVFQVTTNGGLTSLHHFLGGVADNNGNLTNRNGFQPNALTLGIDGNLYGTTRFGGSNGNGTVFRINLTPVRILVDHPTFGVRTNQFGFTAIGTNAMGMVLEACTNLNLAAWSPVKTNTGTEVLSYFSDPDWTNYRGRFYRLRTAP